MKREIKNNPQEKFKKASNNLNKVGFTLKEFSETISKTVKFFQESRTAFNELKKIKPIK